MNPGLCRSVHVPTLRWGAAVAGQAADVFVSYKAEDRSRLAPLVDALEAEGFSVWWDAQIGGGAHWREDIQEHLESAKCVIVAWSKRSVGHDGHFVRDEANRAQRRGVYVPVRLDPVEPPLGFGEVQAISLKGWHGDRSDPRFVALADTVRECITGEHIAHHPGPRDKTGISRRAVVGGGIGVGAVAVTAAGGWLLLKPSTANAKRIAVLPFANLSNDPEQAYFSEGVAEELRTALSRIGMQVIGRTSSDAVKDLDAKVAAGKLGVANILTGSVRRSPQMIRINAQLVSGSDGVERWAQSYDRAPGDVIKIQTDIAENVAEALSIALGQVGRAALTLGGTSDSIAQDLILQSKQLSRQASGAETNRRRIELAEQAIVRDPNYAEAYAEKANALWGLATNYPTDEAVSQLAQADAAARKAVTLAPGLASAHLALANVAEGRLDFASALREAKRSLALSPEDADMLGNVARLIGRLESAQDALRLVQRAIALDPLNARLYYRKTEALVFLGRYADAIEPGRKALQLSPKYTNTHLLLGDAMLLAGQPAKAKAHYEALGADDPFSLARLSLLAARTGDRAGAERTMAQLRQQVGAAASYQYGEIYAQLGDKDRAFAELDNAIQAKDSGLDYLKVDPFLDPIRSDPRYAALLRRVNFP